MANVTAAMVKELREATGVGMMECKKALTEADGALLGHVFAVIAKLAKEHGVRVILNTAPYQPVTDEFLKGCWLVTPNEVEAEEMTGVAVTDLESANRAAKVFFEKGVENVLITLGSRGVYINTGDRAEIVPAFRVKAVDTTGAGDAFNGGLLAALAEGKDIWEAARFASGLAALSVQRIGTTPAMPTREEIDAFLAEH